MWAVALHGAYEAVHSAYEAGHKPISSHRSDARNVNDNNTKRIIYRVNLQIRLYVWDRNIIQFSATEINLDLHRNQIQGYFLIQVLDPQLMSCKLEKWGQFYRSQKNGGTMCGALQSHLRVRHKATSRARGHFIQPTNAKLRTLGQNQGQNNQGYIIYLT